MKSSIPFLLFFSMTACASTNNCGESASQIVLNKCAVKNLETIESKIDSLIRSFPEEIAKSNSFITANESWLNYRQDHCKSVSNIYEGGSIQGFIETQCKVSLSNKRFDTLSNDYNDAINIITKGSP